MSSTSRTKGKAATTKTNAPTLPAKPKGWILETAPDLPGQTHDQVMAQFAARGIVGNARTLIDFSAATFGELALTDCARVLKETATAVHAGDLSSAETMLMSQAIALNAIFGDLARRSGLNMGEYLDASERYMRLALKAQGQCRATLETLAAIKNPPVVFARQANINNGGQQQVNNGTVPTGAEQPNQYAPASASAGKSGNEPNKLLERHDGERLDTGAQGETSGVDTALATVGAVNRAA